MALNLARVGLYGSAAAGAFLFGRAGWRRAKAEQEAEGQPDLSEAIGSSLMRGIAGAGIAATGFMLAGRLGASKMASAGFMRAGAGAAGSFAKTGLRTAGALATVPYKAFKAFDRLPLIAKGAITIPAAVGISAAAMIGAKAMEQTEANATAVRDEMGGYEYQPHTVKERLLMMNASGDMVMGLHNGRHG